MASEVQPLPGAPAPEKSEFARLTGVLVDPKPAFGDIAAHPRWWPPVVVVIAVSLVFLYAFSQRVGWEQFMRQTIESNSRTQNLPAEQRERLIEQQTAVASKLGYVGAIVGTPIYLLAAAGVLLFIFRLILGAQLTFRQVFAVTAYSALTGVVASLLALLVMFLKPAEDFNLQNPLAFNVGAYLDPQTTGKFAHSLATSVDAFSIWTILLLATGLAVAAPKLTWSKALVGVAVPWLVLILVKGVWVGMFG